VNVAGLVFAVSTFLAAATPDLPQNSNWADCEAGDPVRSIRGCTRILEGWGENDYNRSVAHNDRGLAYRRLGEQARAIIDHSAAIQLAPEDAAGFYNRGNAYFDEGNFDRAIADYDKAIRLGRGIVPAAVELGKEALPTLSR
jgi:tetratricopeptide (TPR) repeat protein